MDSRRATRFTLVSAAQRFVITVLPFRQPDSRDALTEFTAAISRTHVAASDANAILLEVLAILDTHVPKVKPTLVDRFVRRNRSVAVVDTFRYLVEAALTFQAVGDPYVRSAIAEINSHFADPQLRRRLAKRLGLSRASLAARFLEATGTYPIEHLRNVRLDHAAQELSRSGASVKEVWASVGYNMPSTFNHDFKKRFGSSPTEYRANWRPLPLHVDEPRKAVTEPPKARNDGPGGPTQNVVVVDDDEPTRETLAYGLRLQGYAVITATSAEECLTVVAALPCRAIVVDYHLPGMDGLQCVQLLRERHFNAPAVICSADWDLEDREHEFHALGARYLSKPCSIDTLIEAVTECVVA